MYPIKKIDSDGIYLCEMQAKTFELSIDTMDCSSEIFIRRTMNSDIIKLLDTGGIFVTNLMPKDLLERVTEQYGYSNYGSTKYTHNEMYWIGYMYRYFAYTYDLSSAQAYHFIKPKELRSVFLPYHTLDPSQAIERILEAKNLLTNEETELLRQYEIFKRIRNENQK